MATIIIPTPLRKFTDNQSKVLCAGATVRDSVKELTENFPELKQHVLNEDGTIRQFIRIFLEDEDINTLNKERTKLRPNSTLSIVPAIAGGIK